MKCNGLIAKSEYNTAGLAKMIFEKNLRNYAAVASKLAAKVYNLEVLEEGIEDDPNNVTRFFLLSKKSLIPWRKVLMKLGILLFSIWI